MATTHFARTVYKGRSGDGMAAQRVDYITRQGAYSPAEARIRHQGLQHGTDYEREDLVFWKVRNLPTWAENDPVRFFHAAEQHTSPYQTAYEEWKIALPRELTRRGQLDAARDFLHEAFGDTHPYVWAMHDPRAADGGRQPHVHVLWSARTLDHHERSPEQFFTRYNRAHPERGGAEKASTFHHFGSVKAFRTLYTDTMNLHLEAAGHVARLHPDRLSDRGMDREPEPRLRPSDSNALKYEGHITERMQEVLDHRQARQQHAPKERVQAREYWEGRKAELGITRDMPMEEKLGHIRAARVHSVSHKPHRPSRDALQQEAQVLTQRVQALASHVSDLQQVRAREQRIERDRTRRDWKQELAAERVLARGKVHGLGVDHIAERAVAQLTRLIADLDHDEQMGARLNVRLQAQDRSRDDGLSW